MCGILGTIGKSFDNQILNLIKHRGPDDGNILKLMANNKEVCLGHRRLAIQDLSSAGRQPMYSSCGRFVIIFNGEIYNHIELRKKLSDIKWRGHSDTETIVNYMARYGIESIRDFNGIFCFGLFDIENSKLYLVRDRYGVKPIYFAQNSNVLIFSSELKPIKQLISSQIDKTNLATLLKIRYSPSPITPYKDIYKLRPGHIFEYDLYSDQLSISSFTNSVYVNKKISFYDAIKKYGELFEKAIKRQLLSDVEVGVLLSGGIDSALVAYYAQKRCKNVKTFTIGFDEDDESDETLDAKETARLLGTDHYEIKISDGQFENIFQQCIEIVEEPLGTTSIIPMYYLNELVASYGIKVVLTGQGADEPLGGYARYRGEMIHGKVPSVVFDVAKYFSRFIKNESIYRAINSLGEKELIKRWSLIYALTSDEEIQKLINVDESKSKELIGYFYDLLKGNNKDSVNAMMSNDMRMNLSDDLLLYTDKISMNFSIEARVPMLDNDLMDFVESLPLEYKIQGKEGKYIHKKFAEGILPKEIIYRKKKGFKSPTEKWFRGEKGLKYKNMLIEDSGFFSEIFNISEVAKIFDTHMQGKRNMEKQLFTLISIYYWIEGNKKQHRQSR
jgi:asparagine synthase (glutamine-hydrolysing)